MVSSAAPSAKAAARRGRIRMFVSLEVSCRMTSPAMESLFSKKAAESSCTLSYNLDEVKAGMKAG
jgi:hypothetical protein